MSASVSRTGDTLHFSGTLDRAASAGVWKQVQPLLDGVRSLEVHAVGEVDSAGLALLAEIAARCGAVEIVGAPVGLAELRAAYRLDDTLAFAG